MKSVHRAVLTNFQETSTVTRQKNDRDGCNSRIVGEKEMALPKIFVEDMQQAHSMVICASFVMIESSATAEPRNNGGKLLSFPDVMSMLAPSEKTSNACRFTDACVYVRMVKQTFFPASVAQKEEKALA